MTETEQAVMSKADLLDLLDLFICKATEPLPDSSLMIVRHFQCKESLKAAQSLIEVLDRFARRNDHPLSAPPELLAPPM
jgi:hypothetical protein